jgi:hypothetical protein
VKTRPDIQKLLGRHLAGDDKEKEAIQKAMNARVMARAARLRADDAKKRRDKVASEGLRYINAGRKQLAAEAYAEAQAAEAEMSRWIEAEAEYLRVAASFDSD